MSKVKHFTFRKYDKGQDDVPQADRTYKVLHFAHEPYMKTGAVFPNHHELDACLLAYEAQQANNKPRDFVSFAGSRGYDIQTERETHA